MVKIAFEIGNDAFDDGYSGRIESARILREIADTLENGSPAFGGVYDANGNRVGAWSIDAREASE